MKQTADNVPLGIALDGSFNSPDNIKEEGKHIIIACLCLGHKIQSVKIWLSISSLKIYQILPIFSSMLVCLIC